MKKFRRVLALILTVSSLLAITAMPALAAETVGSRLAAFEDVGQMTSNTFSDLNTKSWYYSGVKTAYNKGIMLGYPDKTFGPNNTVTWAEAVTIAARMHAAYNSNRLYERGSDSWFVPFYKYCADHKLLPKSVPAQSKADTTVISRYDLAYMFARVIDKEDMPAISDKVIGDLSSIPSYYKQSVELMYSSGIMDGMDKKYSFLGTSTTTRAQIATVIARIVEPALRKGSDAKVNAAMASYEANLENDSIVVQIGSVSYGLYKNYVSADTVNYSLYKVDANGRSTKLFTAADGKYLANISAYNSCVYFSCSSTGSEKGSLMCYNPSSGKLSTVYDGYIVESYCFYNGSIYALAFTQYADKPEGYRYLFGRIANGSFTALMPELTYAQAANFVPYGWNGKIYFKLSETVTVTSQSGAASNVSVDKLHSYDIASGTTEKVCDYMINTSLFSGHVMYFMAYDTDGNYDLNLYAISVQAPGAVTLVGTFPKATDTKYRSIYKFGSSFYCLSSFNRNVYSMDKTGSTRLELMCGGVYDSMNFTADKIVLIPNTLTTSNANELKVYNAKSFSARSLYGDWLGQSVYYEGARFVPEDGKGYVSDSESVSTVSDLPILVTKAFSRGSDFVVQTKYTNNLTSDIKLRSYIVKVYLNGQLVAYDLNRMVGIEMKQYDVRTFTFVIAGADVLKNFDINDGHISIEIIPTYDIVVTA